MFYSTLIASWRGGNLLCDDRGAMTLVSSENRGYFPQKVLYCRPPLAVFERTYGFSTSIAERTPIYRLVSEFMLVFRTSHYIVG